MELEDSQHSELASDARRVAPFIGALLLAAAGIVFAVREHNLAQTAAAQRQVLADDNKQMTARLNETQDQLANLSAKVSALSAPAQPAASSSLGAGSGRRPAPGRASDPRFKKLQSQLDAQGKLIDAERGDIDSTRTDLASARTELSGSIAKTHDELVVLEKKGELNFYEFDITGTGGFLNRTRDFKREGPVSICLRKADAKHGFADLALIVDDRNLTQKHINLYQPAMFYEPDSMRPVEIVINDISKNHIHGYVSAPKYHKSDLAAAPDANAIPGADQATNTQPAPRKKLSISNDDVDQQ